MSCGKQASLTLATLLLLGACSHSAQSIATSQGDLRKIRAEEVTAELKLAPQESSGRLGESERLAVSYFAEAYQGEGHGQVVILRPASVPQRAAHEARAVLLAAGVDPAAIDEGGYDNADGNTAPLILSYRTWEAKVSDCPTINQTRFENTASNTTLPSFGCSVAINLAAMIADPSDLIGEQAIDPADATRRAIVFEKYRNGQPTATESQASGAISGAIGN